MPLLHSEEFSHLEDCMEKLYIMRDEADAIDEYNDEYMENAIVYAMERKYVLSKYSRLPERNRFLGRASTPEEIQYLEYMKKKENEENEERIQ